MSGRAQSNVVKFPTARVVRRRTFMHHLEDTGTSEARKAIETEMFSVRYAIKALRRQQQSLIVRLRYCVHCEVDAVLGEIEIPDGGAAS